MVIEGIDFDFVHSNEIGSTPSKVRIVIPHKKAIIFFSDKMQEYPEATQNFILRHEIGHAVLNSGDEVAVDRWAYNQHIKDGYSPGSAVFALTKVLDPIEEQDHEERTIRQFYRAKHTQFLRGKMKWSRFKNLKL